MFNAREKANQVIKRFWMDAFNGGDKKDMKLLKKPFKKLMMMGDLYLKI